MITYQGNIPGFPMEIGKLWRGVIARNLCLSGMLARDAFYRVESITQQTTMKSFARVGLLRSEKDLYYLFLFLYMSLLIIFLHDPNLSQIPQLVDKQSKLISNTASCMFVDVHYISKRGFNQPYNYS